jgi:hypothetical protein
VPLANPERTDRVGARPALVARSAHALRQLANVRAILGAAERRHANCEELGTVRDREAKRFGMTTGNDGQQQNRSRTTHLRVRFHGKRGARVLSVFCPRKLKIVDTIECNGCEHGLDLTFNTEARALFMACGWPPKSLQLPTAADTAERWRASSSSPSSAWRRTPSSRVSSARS